MTTKLKKVCPEVPCYLADGIQKARAAGKIYNGHRFSYSSALKIGAKVLLDIADGEDILLQKKNRNKEKRTSKGRVLTVEAAILRPENDYSKEKKISKGYAGTVQDADWHPKKEPDDCSREDTYDSNRVQGEYEN